MHKFKLTLLKKYSVMINGVLVYFNAPNDEVAAMLRETKIKLAERTQLHKGKKKI